MVSDHKGLNLPGVAVSVPALSEKDKEDLRWGIEQDADFIALSFVRSAKDIKDVHEIMDEMGKRIPVIAKIEKPQAVEALEEIVEAFDGIMVPAATSASRCPSRPCRLFRSVRSSWLVLPLSPLSWRPRSWTP